MTVPPAVLVAAGLLAVAVLVWPRPEPTGVLPRQRAASASPRRVGWGWRPRRARAEDVEAVLTLLDALGPALRAGLPPGDALRAVAPDGAVTSRPADDGTTVVVPEASVSGPPGDLLVTHLCLGADRGEPLAPIWRDWAAHTGSSDLVLVASAWALCERLGVPLASTVSTVAAVIRRRLEVQRRTAAALAGPRASMTVLTALPVAGPLLALVMGLSPVDLYASPAGAAALGVGLLLLLLGRWWGSRLIRSIDAHHPARGGRVS